MNGSFAFYMDAHDSFPDIFWNNYNIVKDNCSDCARYVSGTHYGYPVHGCNKYVDFIGIMDGVKCKEKQHKQLTLQEVIS